MKKSNKQNKFLFNNLERIEEDENTWTKTSDPDPEANIGKFGNTKNKNFTAKNPQENWSENSLSDEPDVSMSDIIETSDDSFEKDFKDKLASLDKERALSSMPTSKDPQINTLSMGPDSNLSPKNLKAHQPRGISQQSNLHSDQNQLIGNDESEDESPEIIVDDQKSLGSSLSEEDNNNEGQNGIETIDSEMLRYNTEKLFQNIDIDKKIENKVEPNQIYNNFYDENEGEAEGILPYSINLIDIQDEYRDSSDTDNENDNERLIALVNEEFEEPDCQDFGKEPHFKGKAKFIRNNLSKPANTRNYAKSQISQQNQDQNESNTINYNNNTTDLNINTDSKQNNIQNNFESTLKHSHKTSEKNIFGEKKDSFINTNLKERIINISKYPNKFSLSSNEDQLQIDRDNLDKMDSQTDSIGVTPLSTWKVETNLVWEENPEEQLDNILENSKSEKNTRLGGQFIIFMDRFYQDKTEESYLNLIKLIKNLNSFFRFNDESIMQSTISFLKEMFDCAENVKALTFRRAVEDYEGLVGFYLFACIESVKHDCNKKMEHKMELNEKICLETERQVDDIKEREMKLKETELNLKKDSKNLQKKFLNQYENLFESLTMKIDKKMKPQTQKLDSYESSKKKGDTARLGAQGNSQDVYKKRNQDLKSEIASMTEKYKKASETLKHYKSMEKNNNPAYMKKIKNYKKEDKGVQVDFTVVENGEEIFSTAKRNTANSCNLKSGISGSTATNSKCIKNKLISVLLECADKEIDSKNWRSSSHILVSILYNSRDLHDNDDDKFLSIEKQTFDKRKNMSPSTKISINTSGGITTTITKSIKLSNYIKIVDRFAKIAEDDKGRQILSDKGFLKLILKEEFLTKQNFAYLLKLILICLQNSVVSKKIFECLDSEYCIRWLIAGILEGINTKQPEIVEQGLLTMQRLTTEKTLGFEIRKYVLDMCKVVKEWIGGQNDKKYRFIIINLNSILSNLE